MAAKRAKRRGEEEDADKLSKEDEAVAKFVRFNTPTESTLYQQNEVHYFTGAKAVDALVEGKYGAKAKKDPAFPNRATATIFMQRMLEKNLFHRVRKLVAKKKEDKLKELEKGDDSARAGRTPKMDSPKPKKKEEKKKEEKKKAEEKEKDDSDEKNDKAKEDEKDDEDKKRKKKVKLEPHAVQVFNDSSDVYVWVFDPTPFYKKLIGLLMVLGTIVGCLFPLWPMWLRQGVYYLSIAGIGFFGVVFGVAILRTILFALLWAVTLGEHNLWVLPNLLADVGFWESFKPFYTYERASEAKNKDKKKKKDGKKEKNSDAEEEEEKAEEEEPKEEKKDSAAAEKAEGQEEIEEEGSATGSGSDDVTGGSQTGSDEEEEAEKPASSSEQKVRRRPRKEDGDFVIVNK